jgi:hypothetical protein
MEKFIERQNIARFTAPLRSQPNEKGPQQCVRARLGFDAHTNPGA